MSDDLSGFSLMDLFRSEAETHAATLTAGLLALEGVAQATPEAVEPLMRAAHSLKGAARIVDLEPAVHVAHALEDVLVALQLGQLPLRPSQIDPMLAAVDLLSEISQLDDASLESWTAANTARVDSAVASLHTILSDGEPQAPVPRSTAVHEDLSGFSLADLFRSEAETHLAALSDGLLHLEGPARDDPATFENLMRAAHSLKGAAAIVGVDAAARIAHALEDVFVAVQLKQCLIQPGHVDLLLRAVDLIAQISRLPDDQFAPWSFANHSLVETLVSQVQAIPSGVTPKPLPPPTSPLPAAAAPIRLPENPAPEPPVASATEDRVVKVTAESLTRLMSLAGESLVQSRQLRPFVDSLLDLKTQQTGLLDALQSLQERQDQENGRTSAADREAVNKARGLANRFAQSLTEKTVAIEDFARRSEDLSGRLHHEVMTSRMRPLADGVRGFPRTIRDIARSLDKKVRFVVVGESTGVDRDILEKLEAPLNHLIRNCLDHAIELPDARLAARKPETGTIKLEARHRAGMLQITLSDDGRGIDLARLRAKIVERGLTTLALAEQLDEAELLEFLFLPGFSTKEKVTELSGRGVGLDVVQNMVRAVGGVVRVTTQAGQGTRFTLQLPITMSVIRALLVRIAGEPYAFPLNRIDRIVMLQRSAIQSLEGRQHFLMDDQPVGLVDACQVLHLPAGPRGQDVLPVVVASDRHHRFGVVVDEFLGERDLEVRPLDSRLGKVPNINSASLLEDGWPVLIFDIEDLVRSVDNLLSGRRLVKLDEAAQRADDPAAAVRRVLVVDDSLTVRETERQILETAGYSVEVAVDGLDGWNAVRTGDYHLVISDVDMPRMDGIQFVTLIKSDPRLRSTPVVIVSYKDREEDRMRGLDAGANAYLTKSSFRDQSFLRTVVDLIGEAQP